MNNEATTLTLPVPEDGKVHVKFRLKDKVLMLFIRVSIVASRTASLARFIMSIMSKLPLFLVFPVVFQAKFQSSQGTLRVSSRYSSPTGSYIQVSANTSPAQV